MKNSYKILMHRIGIIRVSITRLLKAALPLRLMPEKLFRSGRPKRKWFKMAEYFESGLSLNGERTIGIVKASSNTVPLPKSVQKEVHARFKEVQQTDIAGADVTVLRNASIWGGAGMTVVYNHRGELLVEASPDALFLKSRGLIPHAAYTSIHPGSNRVVGTIADITMYQCQYWKQISYGHWVVDLLPRLSLLEEANVNLHEIDVFLLPSLEHTDTCDVPDFVKSLFLERGIEGTKLVPLKPGHRWYADYLYIPSRLLNRQGIGPWIIDAIRRHPIGPANPVKRDRIYYARTGGKSGRAIQNEEEVRETLRKAGYIVIDSSQYTIPEQRRLIHDADFLIVPNGSGLMNLPYCKPGTSVLHLHSRSYVNPTYRVLSHYADLDHWVLAGDPVNRVNNNSPVTQNYRIDPELLRQSILAMERPWFT